MTDIHIHVLPGVDDGAKSCDEAVRMCEMAVEDGIEHLVATPHANYRYPYDREAYAEMLLRLAERIGGKPKLSLGCDLALTYENLQQLAATPSRYTIDATPYVLVEFSDFVIPPGIAEVFRRLLSTGLVPIITHPERNSLLQAEPQRVVEWVRLGCAVQVTASAITGEWRPRAQKTAEWLIARQAAHVIATDAHGSTGRIPVLSKARDTVAKRFGAELAQALVVDNPRAVVDGRPLPARSTPVET